MAYWSCEVRTLLMQADLLGRLAVFSWPTNTDYKDQPTAALYYRDVKQPEKMDGEPTPDTYHKLAEFVRPTEEDFQEQTRLVLEYADLRAERLGEIITQIDLPMAFYGNIIGLDGERHAHTNHILTLVTQLCAKVAMMVKNALASKRPETYSPQIQPVIPSPGHSALPSGHATQAFAIALVLAELIDASREVKQMFLAQAARIATNRTVAGVHFPVDSIAGLALGRAIADFVVSLATAPKKACEGTKPCG
ncbi:MAG: phosphatase PAP2 family protein [Pseudomonadota bacterium]